MKVKSTQIGITTRCNSNCFYCFREELKREGRKEGRIDLPIEAIERVLQQGVTNVHLCGNRGEAIFHPQITEIIDMIKEAGSRFEMNTNGDNFNEKWWYELGQKMTGSDKIVFALDGLANLHPKYRRTNWLNVFNNMKAFINGGGDAVWQMILFDYNENQKELVKKVSKSIGCSQTWIINSRHYKESFYNKESIHHNETFGRPKNEYNITKHELMKTKKPQKIECRFLFGERVYIDVYGKVWPCCFMKCNHGFYETAYKGTVWKTAQEESDFIDVMNTPLDEIVKKSKLFNFLFDNIYNDTYNYACRRHCGNIEEIDKKNRRIIKNKE